jgi:uncharacterized membrane protein
LTIHDVVKTALKHKIIMKKEKNLIEKTLDFLGTISIIVFFISLILKIWMNSDVQWILNRMWLTSLVVFAFIFVFYGFVLYKPKDNE